MRTPGHSTLLGVGVWVAALAACGSDSKTNQDGGDCPNGICASGGGSNTSKGGKNGAGTANPGGANNTSAGQGSGSGGVASGGSSGKAGAANVGGDGSCVEKWLCTPWETNGTNDMGMRSCDDENACGTTTGKPSEQAQLPALDLNYYKCNVEPIANRKCSMLGCHGTEKGRALRLYARGKLRAAGEIYVDQSNACLSPARMTPSEDCIGAIECRCYWEPHRPVEWQRNYDSARGFALDAAGAPLPAGQEDDSELIAQAIVGGKAHAGIHLFKAGDPEHVTLKAWLAGAKLATCTTNN